MSDLWWKLNDKTSPDDFVPGEAKMIKKYDTPYFIIKKSDDIFFQKEGTLSAKKDKNSLPCIGILPVILPNQFGNAGFQADHNTKYSYMAGAMANGISSEEMVISLGKKGYLASFGTGGLSLLRIEKAIKKIQKELPNGPYTFNLLHNPYDSDYENRLIDLYMKYNIRSIEAAAFINPSPALAYFKISGLTKSKDGKILSINRIIAKLSRQEVAVKFMEPTSEIIINGLLALDKITPEQALLAKQVPLADDITVEADSGGHTDNRPLVSLIPSIISIRDRVQSEFNYSGNIRVGAAGGISTPQAALAAFSMGADYIVTGSVNQSCVEAGTSKKTRELLSKANMADVMMAPSADMFEMGGKVQVLKSGTMFPMIAQKLFEIYKGCSSIEEIPIKEKDRLEKKVFKKDMETIWEETTDYFKDKDPELIRKAMQNPKKKMALVFRWYLGKSSLWPISGEEDRMIDAQIWCGQAMGAFNDWVKGTRMEEADNRNVAEVADLILKEAAILSRIGVLKNLNVPILEDFKKKKTLSVSGTNTK